MRETRPSGSEGRGTEPNRSSLPLSRISAQLDSATKCHPSILDLGNRPSDGNFAADLLTR